MAYEYEHRIQEIIWSNEDYWCIDNDKESKELHEVYRKAKILNKIIDIVKTGRSLEDFGDVEVTLLAIEHELNYILEDKKHE